MSAIKPMSLCILSLAISGCSLIDVETTRTETAPDDAAIERVEQRMDNIEDRLERIEALLSKRPV